MYFVSQVIIKKNITLRPLCKWRKKWKPVGTYSDKTKEHSDFAQNRNPAQKGENILNHKTVRPVWFCIWYNFLRRQHAGNFCSFKEKKSKELSYLIYIKSIYIYIYLHLFAYQIFVVQAIRRAIVLYIVNFSSNSWENFCILFYFSLRFRAATCTAPFSKKNCYHHTHQGQTWQFVEISTHGTKM